MPICENLLANCTSLLPYGRRLRRYKSLGSSDPAGSKPRRPGSSDVTATEWAWRDGAGQRCVTYYVTADVIRRRTHHSTAGLRRGCEASYWSGHESPESCHKRDETVRLSGKYRTSEIAMRGIPMSQKYRGIISDGIMYRRFAKHRGILSGGICQLPKLCVKISILMHRLMWVRSVSTRITSVTFAEDKVFIFLILRKNAKIVQL